MNDKEVQELLPRQAELKKRYLSEDIPMYKLAEEYGVKTKTISNIIRG